MGSSASQATLFSLLPPTRTPWTEFAFSAGTQAAAIAFLIWVRLLYPAVVSPPEHSLRSTQLVSTPVPVSHQPQRTPQVTEPVAVALVETTNPVRLSAPPAKPQVHMEEPAAPTVPLAARKVDPLPLRSAPVIPKQAVKTNVFSEGSSAAPTIAKASSQVQSGGFGDPNGIPAHASQGKAVNIAAVGSFDLPSGAGSGNGNGGAKGVAGVVASSGFGGGTATPVRNHGPSGSVQASGFASADALAPSPVRSPRAESATLAVPAQIVSKPLPAYTQEAKNLRIEGEVLLEVVLRASGSLRVVRVVRGLGHGLDDNAVKAAEQIQFKPAMRDGQPADSTVVLHIIFQLA